MLLLTFSTRNAEVFFSKRPGDLNRQFEIAVLANIPSKCWCAGLRFGHPASVGEAEEEPCWQPFMRSSSIVKKSACIMLNICTTHNGDYAPFRQRHFDLLPWNITPASQLSLPLFPLKWRTLLSETGGIPPTVYMIALLQLLVCVQLDGLGGDGRWRWGGHNLKLALFKALEFPYTACWMILTPSLQIQAYLMEQIIQPMQQLHMRSKGHGFDIQCWDLFWHLSLTLEH